MFAIDIETFRTLSDFENDADALIAIVKALPRQAGFDEILLPGERGNRTETARRASGIPIPKKLWEELGVIAKAHGVTPLQAATANWRNRACAPCVSRSDAE
jgi:LDH2 family malate/lactate/ureidoglycolate dehydrogenase